MKKLAASTSAAALVFTGLTVGAGFANAQDAEAPVESSGSLTSGSLGVDTGEISANLDLAITALNSPVSVEGRNGDGPLVSYTNRTAANPEDAAAGTKYCIGFTMPYSTIDELELEVGDINSGDFSGAQELLTSIDEAGGVSILGVNEGKPFVHASEGNALAPFAAKFANGGAGLAVAPGATVTWEAPTPTDQPATAVVLCSDAAEGRRDSGIDPQFGMDKQIIADQINAKIPGGSLDLVTPGSISGGTLETIQGSLGSLTGNFGDTEEAGETPAAPAQ